MLDLGSFGGTFGGPNALNNRGQVVGDMNMPGDLTHHPFLWDRGSLTDLGTLGGDNGDAEWINDAGEVVGDADYPIPCPGCGTPQIHRAFLWRKGVMTDLGTVDKCSVAWGINSRGQIVGASGICGTAVHAFLWENGGPMID